MEQFLTTLERISPIPRTPNTRKHKYCDAAISCFTCPCQICNFQIKGNHSIIISQNDIRLQAKYQQRNFCWVLQSLGQASQQNQILLNIPQTAVFYKGRPVFILVCTRENSLRMITSPDKLKPQQIIKSFSNIARVRKREQVRYSQNVVNQILLGIAKKINHVVQSKQTAMLRYYQGENQDGPLRVMNDHEFTQLMWERASSNVWRKIVYIQTILKFQGGIGESVLYWYYSKPDINLPDLLTQKKRLKQDFKNPLLEKLESGSLQNISSEKQLYQTLSLRIVYFVALYTNFQIKRMQVEFLHDDSNKVWVIYINKILLEQLDIPDYNQQKILIKKGTEQLSEQKKQAILKYLQYTAKLPKSTKVQALTDMMDSHYQQIKIQSGAIKLFKEDNIDYHSDNAFRKLRPLCPYQLHQIIDAKIGKTQLQMNLQPVRKRPANRSFTKFTPVVRRSVQERKSTWKVRSRIRPRTGSAMRSSFS